MRIRITETPEFKSGGGFKINKNHIGFCTPMTKSTCTGKRRQFAINAKNHFKKQQQGGPYHPWPDYIPNTSGQYVQYQPYQAPQAQQPQQYQMDPNQMQAPLTQPMNPGMQLQSNPSSDMTYNWNKPGKMERPDWKDRWWANPDLWNAGMAGATNIINNLPGGAQDRLKKWNKMTRTADWMNPSSQGSRGDYDTNSGRFRPDQTVPVQYQQDGGEFQEGGEYDMNPEQLQEFLRNGGEVDYL